MTIVQPLNTPRAGERCPSHDDLKVGKCLIVGLGSIGRRHLQNLRDLGVQEFVFLRTQRGSLGELDGEGAVIVHDLDAALDAKPHFAVIANPSSLHIPIALACADRGIHLFIEKPVSNRLDHCEELEALVRSRGVTALVGFQFRFHPGLGLTKKLIEEGAIGKVVGAQSHWGEYLPDWHPWEDHRRSYSAKEDLGGGVILTLCHPFDYLRWLLGDVEHVSAFVSNSGVLDIAVEDIADIQLKFCSGANGHVHLNYIQRPPVHRLLLIGECGTIAWDNADGAVQMYRAATSLWERFPVPEGFERNHLFVSEMRHFLGCLSGNATPVCTLSDGIEALRIALSAKESARGNRVVSRN